MNVGKLMRMAKISAGLARNNLGPVGMTLVKHSPKIFTGVGIVGILGGTVLCCRAYSETEDRLEFLTEEKSHIVNNHKDEVYPTEESKIELNKELASAKRKAVKDILLLWAPGVVVEGSGIACMLIANRILSKRCAAYAAAAIAAETRLKNYQDGVKALNPEMDKKALVGETVKEEKDEKTGKVKKQKTIDFGKWSPYSVTFDKTTSNEWTGSYEYDMQFIMEVERYFNHQYNHYGRTFLNDVYRKLGIKDPETGMPVYIPEGQLVGWLKDGDGDGFIEIRMAEFDKNGEAIMRPTKDAAAKYAGFRLDFNVDGVIFDRA